MQERVRNNALQNLIPKHAKNSPKKGTVRPLGKTLQQFVQEYALLRWPHKHALQQCNARRSRITCRAKTKPHALGGNLQKHILVTERQNSESAGVAKYSDSNVPKLEILYSNNILGSKVTSCVVPCIQLRRMG